MFVQHEYCGVCCKETLHEDGECSVCAANERNEAEAAAKSEAALQIKGEDGKPNLDKMAEMLIDFEARIRKLEARPTPAERLQ